MTFSVHSKRCGFYLRFSRMIPAYEHGWEMLLSVADWKNWTKTGAFSQNLPSTVHVQSRPQTYNMLSNADTSLLVMSWPSCKWKTLRDGLLIQENYFLKNLHSLLFLKEKNKRYKSQKWEVFNDIQ